MYDEDLFDGESYEELEKALFRDEGYDDTDTDECDDYDYHYCCCPFILTSNKSG